MGGWHHTWIFTFPEIIAVDADGTGRTANDLTDKEWKELYNIFNVATDLSRISVEKKPLEAESGNTCTSEGEEDEK